MSGCALFTVLLSMFTNARNPHVFLYILPVYFKELVIGAACRSVLRPRCC